MKSSKILILNCVLFLVLSPFTRTTIKAEEANQLSSVTSNESYSPKQDLYQYANHEWLATTELIPSSPVVNTFSQLEEKIALTLSEDIFKILTGELKPDIPGMTNFVNYFQVASDFEAREQAGMSVLEASIAPNKEMTTVSDLNNRLIELFTKGYATPFTWQIVPDVEDSQKYLLSLDSINTILPDVSLYSDPITRDKLLNRYRSSSLKILKLAGYNDADAEKLVKDALAFDQLLVPTALSSVDHAYGLSFNIKPFEKVANYSKNLDLGAFITNFFGQTPERILVRNPAFFKLLDRLINDDNLPLFNAWAIVSTLRQGSNFTTEAARQALGEYEQLLYGTSKISTKEESIYNLATTQYREAIGLYYGKKYFSEEARQDVTQMIQKIMATYKRRLAANKWLSKETIDNAIKKLENLTIYVGYPDHLSQNFPTVEINTTKSFVDNVQLIKEHLIQKNIALFSQPVDKTEWPEPAHSTGAFYSTQTNSIYFPAGFLQAPYYSKEQTVSQNYGGLGAVIGHEISHAFDSTGAQFDEKGNLKDWWTNADYAAFQEKTQAMIDQWNELSFNGTPVNGKLTLTENTADAGGLSVALETLKEIDGANLQEFFLQWAQIWREKTSPEYSQLAIRTDAHAPSPLRANVVPSNLDDFYTTFDIQPGDPMYRAPEKRVSIW